MDPAVVRYMPRLVDSRIRGLIGSNRIIRVEGPLRCGKSRTVSNHVSSLFALDDPSGNRMNLRLARANASYAVRGDDIHAIDEWQSVPSIQDTVLKMVSSGITDRSFILCGSSMPPVNSVASCGPQTEIPVVRMRTMSLFESFDSDGSVSLAGMFRGVRPQARPRETSLEDIDSLIVRGGWPENLLVPPERQDEFPSRYMYCTVPNQLGAVDRSKDPSRLSSVLHALAFHESTYAGASVLAKYIRKMEYRKVKETTVQDYTSLLDRMFVTENQWAFNPGISTSLRVGRAPKRHLADPSLVAAVFMVETEDEWVRPMVPDALFESLCERDLDIYASTMGGRLLHYRDGKKRGIEAVVELPDGRWGAFGTASSPDLIDNAALLLTRAVAVIEKDPCARNPEFLCVICGTESVAYRRDDGVYVVPIRSLGP